MSDATQSQSNSSFDPEALRILSTALDDAWDRIKNTGSTFGRPSYARAVREVVAQRIIEMAQCGEMDVHRLSDDAVRFLIRLKGNRAAAFGSDVCYGSEADIR
jgi:hypothetical protein